MNITALLIGLGIIIVLVIVGKIFAFLSKIFLVILLIAAIALGVFFWQNNSKDDNAPQTTGFVLQFVV
jgi:low affinity Fe/Cu permease